MREAVIPDGFRIVEQVAFGVFLLSVIGYLVLTIVIWRVRLRFPLSEVNPRLAAVAENTAAERLLVMPAPRRTIESQHSSAHQAAARRPGIATPPPGTVRVALGAGGRRERAETP